MSCSESNFIDAYFDSELSASDAERMRQHVQECAECAATLDELKRLNAFLAAAPLPVAPSDMIDRIEHRWKLDVERSTFRIASWMTVAAAAVLAFGILRFPPQQETVTSAPQVWQTVAVMPPDAREDSRSDSIVLAQWMSDELSSSSRR